MRSTIRIEGVDELKKELTRLASMEHVKKAVRLSGADLHLTAQRNAVFRGHYEWKPGQGYIFVKPTGFLRRNIMGPYLELSGLSARVAAEADYSGYVEMGTRFMAAQPYMRPALNEVEPRFLESLRSMK